MALPLSALDEPGLAKMLADGSAVDTTTCKPRPPYGQPEPKAKLPPEIAGYQYVDLFPSNPAKAAARPAKARKGKTDLVVPGFEFAGGRATWTIPLATVSESNQREHFRMKSARTQAARRAVSRAFGPHLRALAGYAEHYHKAGGAIIVTFTRLGWGKLDKSNLPGAFKAVEDAVALMLGADDGDARWDCRFEQNPGGPVGLKITLEYGVKTTCSLTSKS